MRTGREVVERPGAQPGRFEYRRLIHTRDRRLILFEYERDAVDERGPVQRYEVRDDVLRRPAFGTGRRDRIFGQRAEQRAQRRRRGGEDIERPT